MQFLSEKETKLLEGFRAAAEKGDAQQIKAASDAWVGTPFMREADKAAKEVDETAYAWVDVREFPFDEDGDLNLEILFELEARGSVDDDFDENDWRSSEELRKAAYAKLLAKADARLKRFEAALEAAGFDVQRTPDPDEAVGDVDIDVGSGRWEAHPIEEPQLTFAVDVGGYRNALDR